MGVESVAQSARLGSWCNEGEKQILEIICEKISPGALKLLARIQRRRKVMFFRVSDLIAKYKDDLGPECNIWDVITELCGFNLIYLLFPPSQSNPATDVTKLGTGTGVAKLGTGTVVSNIGTAIDEMFDPLLSLFSLSSDELGSIVSPLGGVVAECLKNSKRRKLSKSQTIIELIKMTSGMCPALPSSYDHQIIIKLCSNYHHFMIILLIVLLLQ